MGPTGEWLEDKYGPQSEFWNDDEREQVEKVESMEA